MNAPFDLKRIIAPPEGKTGWPWTEESPQLPVMMSDGRPWPKISIVTPNYNYAQFIEETIRSVLLQGYPNLEYIIIDGGSTDNSVEIIKKYEKWLAYWTSQQDLGQANAINIGMKLANGDILSYLNSDDILTKGSLKIIAEAFKNKNINWVSGRCLNIDSQSNNTGIDRPAIRKGFLGWMTGVCHLPQPATFWSMQLVKAVGKFDEDLNYMLDYDFFTRCTYFGYKPYLIKDFLAKARYHKDCKTIIFHDNSTFIKHDSLIEREKFEPLLSYLELERIIANEKFVAKITEINEKHKASFLFNCRDLIKLAIKYNWILFDFRFYQCIKSVFLKYLWQLSFVSHRLRRKHN